MKECVGAGRGGWELGAGGWGWGGVGWGGRMEGGGKKKVGWYRKVRDRVITGDECMDCRDLT